MMGFEHGMVTLNAWQSDTVVCVGILNSEGEYPRDRGQASDPREDRFLILPCPALRLLFTMYSGR